MVREIILLVTPRTSNFNKNCLFHFRYKDGSKIKTSSRVQYISEETTNTYSLVINDAVIDDAGKYSVNISNEHGQDSDSCRLTIESAPRFVETMTKKVETQEGNSVSFSVVVEGNPTPNIKW